VKTPTTIAITILLELLAKAAPVMVRVIRMLITWIQTLDNVLITAVLGLLSILLHDCQVRTYFTSTHARTKNKHCYKFILLGHVSSQVSIDYTNTLPL